MRNSATGSADLPTRMATRREAEVDPARARLRGRPRASASFPPPRISADANHSVMWSAFQNSATMNTSETTAMRDAQGPPARVGREAVRGDDPAGQDEGTQQRPAEDRRDEQVAHPVPGHARRGTRRGSRACSARCPWPCGACAPRRRAARRRCRASRGCGSSSTRRRSGRRRTRTRPRRPAATPPRLLCRCRRAAAGSRCSSAPRADAPRSRGGRTASRQIAGDVVLAERVMAVVLVAGGGTARVPRPGRVPEVPAEHLARPPSCCRRCRRRCALPRGYRTFPTRP